ncbi:FAD/NAD(P)-binding oxidoreductase family protein [Prunus dulcis]|uniref:FAD/NAD(P)-binding oxidoreductase family protein n=1 Tax=Prunus dulcis TaxID=3755 RepID=A0A4Y1RIX0_PRUDU|nr:FAD/NAD(P)-binding oxidoreductase family protein [Prunus dulcis]
MTRDDTRSNTIPKEPHENGIKTMRALEVGTTSNSRSPCKCRLFEAKPFRNHGVQSITPNQDLFNKGVDILSLSTSYSLVRNQPHKMY